MGYEGSWSGMRKYLEQEMLADSLRGRIRYNCPSGVNLYEFPRYEICVDDKSYKDFSWTAVNSYFIRQGYVNKPHPMNNRDYWRDFHQLLAQRPPETRTEYTHNEFVDALGVYRQQDIQSSLASDDPIVRMFAVLDRRVGKRTLEKLKETINDQPDWLRYFYELRLTAEGMIKC